MDNEHHETKDATYQDVDRLVAERTAALAQSQQLLRLVMDNIPQAIQWKDRDLVYRGCNQQVADMAGLSSPDEIIGKTAADMPWGKDAARYEADDRRVIETGVPKLNFEQTITRGDGSVHWNRTNKIPLHDAQGQVVGLLTTLEDITAIKQAEAERVRLQQEVIEAQQRAIAELSTPVIPIVEGILVMPLIGSIDSLRAKDIMRTLLSGISEHTARVVIVDITGVPIVDSGVANHLNKTIQAARLKGAQTVITGISEAVAETIVDLGIDWTTIKTLSDLQSGLIWALGALGVRLVRD